MNPECRVEELEASRSGPWKCLAEAETKLAAAEARVGELEAERDEANDALGFANADKAVLMTERDEAWRELSNEIGHHALLKARVAELEKALNLALMHLEDPRAVAAVRAALAGGEES